MEKEEAPIHQRLRDIIKTLADGKQARFAEHVGIGTGAVGDIFGQRKSKPGYDLLFKILHAYSELRAEWLMRGEGPMLTKPLTQDTPPNISAVSEPPTALPRTPKVTLHGGMAVRNYGVSGEKRPPVDTPAQPAAETPPAGTDLIKLVDAHEAKLSEHEQAIAHLHELVSQLQQTHRN